MRAARGTAGSCSSAQAAAALKPAAAAQPQQQGAGRVAVLMRMMQGVAVGEAGQRAAEEQQGKYLKDVRECARIAKRMQMARAYVQCAHAAVLQLLSWMCLSV